MNRSGIPGMLVRLADTGLTVADPDADVRGRTALDGRGNPVGEVDDLLVDELLDQVRFLLVGSGGLLGLGRQRVLVPVEAVLAVEAGVIRLSGSRERLRDVPVYDPELIDLTDPRAGLDSWWVGDLAPLYPFPVRHPHR